MKTMPRKKVKRNNKVGYGQAVCVAIEASGVAEVIRCNESKEQVHVFHRVLDKVKWASILEYILTRKSCWDAHTCQQYFMRGGKLVYGWNFILQPTGELEAAVAEVTKLLVEAAKVVPKVVGSGQLTSFPLVGATPRRTSKISFDPRLPGPDKGGPSHKGAYPIRTED
jgi:hypothetical protein